MAPIMAASAGPGTFIQGFYNFALMIGGVLVFGAIVYGGVLYAASMGNPGRQSEGKAWIKSALLGLLLLAGAYLILFTVNPNLVNLNLPTLQAINIAAPSGGSGSGNGSGSNNCQAPTTGPCANIANLSCFGSVAQTMQSVCGHESGGNPAAPSTVDIGADGNPVSFGLFQINLSANNLINPQTGQSLPCKSAFGGGQYTATNHATYVTNTTLYKQCVALAEDPTANIVNACAISNNGANLSPWTGGCGL